MNYSNFEINAQPAPSRAPPEPPFLQNELRAFVNFLRRRYTFILTGLVIGAVLFGVASFLTVPVYKATTEILLDPRSMSVLDAQPGQVNAVEAPAANSARVDTLAQTLSSTPIVEAVVRAEDLVNDPEFNGSRTSFIRTAISAIVGSEAPASEEQRFAGTIEAVRAAMSAERAESTYHVVVGFQSESPVKAARIANAFWKAYEEYELKSNSDTTHAVAGWMQARLSQLQAQATKAEGDVVDFKGLSGIATADGKSIADTVLADLSSKLSEASGLVAQKKAMLDRIKVINSSEGIDMSVTDALNSEVIGGLRKEYLDTVGEANDLAVRYGENHSAVVKLRQKAQSIAQSGREELKRIETTYFSEYEIALYRQKALKESIDEQFKQTINVSQNQVKLQELETRAAASRKAYEDMLARHTTTVQNESIPVTEARVVGEATPPSTKFKPRRGLQTALGAALGLFAGLGIAMGIDFLDRQIRTRREAEEAIDVTCLGLFPLIEDGRTKPKTFSKTGFVSANRTLPWDYVIQEPFSIGAETVRSVKVALDQRAAKSRCRTIGVTSSLPGEGKSSISVNLAHLMADGGGRVCLIDCDMRHPVLSKNLYRSATGGLQDVLIEGGDYSNLMISDEYLKLDFLPALSRFPVHQYHELLASPAMERLLEKLSERYDYIILDLAPVLPVVDARTIAPLLDAFVFVVGWGDVSRDILQDAMATSPVMKEKIIGTVLNKAKLNKLPRYGEYARSYYSDKYHSAG